MPFKSKSQMKAAFGGYLGPEMKRKAKQWADETPNIKNLPNKKGGKKTYLHGSGELMGHETVMKKVGAMGMMGDKHMMDSESISKMRKQMPKGMMS